MVVVFSEYEIGGSPRGDTRGVGDVATRAGGAIDTSGAALVYPSNDDAARSDAWKPLHIAPVVVFIQK